MMFFFVIVVMWLLFETRGQIVVDKSPVVDLVSCNEVWKGVRMVWMERLSSVHIMVDINCEVFN